MPSAFEIERPRLFLKLSIACIENCVNPLIGLSDEALNTALHSFFGYLSDDLQDCKVDSSICTKYLKFLECLPNTFQKAIWTENLKEILNSR